MAGADMGLGAGYGAGGVADAIRNILEQRQLAAQLSELSRHNQADEALTGRKIDEEAAYRKMQSDALQQDRSVREASTIAGSLSPGDSLLSSPEQTSIPPIANRLAQGGQAPNIGVVPPLSATALPGGAETPSLPSGMGMGGPPPTGGILRTGPSLQAAETPVAPGAVGNVSWLGTPQERKTADLEREQQSFLRTLDPNSQEGKDALYQARMGHPRPAAESGNGEIKDTGSGLARIGRDNTVTPILSNGRPVQGYHPPVQPIVVQTASGPALLDRGRGTASPIMEDGKAVGPKPTAQQVQHEAATKQALSSLNQLDQAIESAKDLIGPGQGRISSLEQMVGNADPKIAALGTKMLLAKMQVDAGIGGARAAASPQLLSRWDNLLANKVTPEGLKAAVQAMREILGGTSTSTTKPTAADLIKKYGGS